MADLTGTKPKATYKDLLQVPNSNTGFDTTLRQIQTGTGETTPLSLATDKVALQGLIYPNTDGSNGQVLTTDGSGNLSFTTVSATSQDLQDTNLILQGTDVASAVNYATVTNSATGDPVLVSVDGTDTNIDLRLESKGTGDILNELGSSGTFRVAAAGGNDIFTASFNGTIDYSFFGGEVSGGSLKWQSEQQFDGGIKTTKLRGISSATLAEIQNVKFTDTSVPIPLNRFYFERDNTGERLFGIQQDSFDSTVRSYIRINYDTNNFTDPELLAWPTLSPNFNSDLRLGSSSSITGGGAGNVYLDGIAYPNTDGTNGQVLTTDGAGALSFSNTAWLNDTVSTTDATTTTITTVTIPTDSQRIITARVYGNEASTQDTKWEVATAGFKNVSGTVTQVGGTSSQSGTDTGASSWAIEFNPLSSTVEIQVTGENSHTIDWNANIEVN